MCDALVREADQVELGGKGEGGHLPEEAGKAAVLSADVRGLKRSQRPPKSASPVWEEDGVELGGQGEGVEPPEEAGQAAVADLPPGRPLGHHLDQLRHKVANACARTQISPASQDSHEYLSTSTLQQQAMLGTHQRSETLQGMLHKLCWQLCKSPDTSINRFYSKLSSLVSVRTLAVHGLGHEHGLLQVDALHTVALPVHTASVSVCAVRCPCPLAAQNILHEQQLLLALHRSFSCMQMPAIRCCKLLRGIKQLSSQARGALEVVAEADLHALLLEGGQGRPGCVHPRAHKAQPVIVCGQQQGTLHAGHLNVHRLPHSTVSGCTMHHGIRKGALLAVKALGSTHCVFTFAHAQPGHCGGR